METVDSILDGTATAVPQSSVDAPAELQPAPKIFKDTCRIDWSRGVKAVYDFVRGLSPYPAAWTELHNGEKTLTLKIFATEKHFCTPSSAVGEVECDGQELFKIATTDGYLTVTELQLAGKRRMNVKDFLRGFHVADDCRVG